MKYETLIESIEEILNDIYEREIDNIQSQEAIVNAFYCIVDGGTFSGYYTLEDIVNNADNERLEDFIENNAYNMDEDTILEMLANTAICDYEIGYLRATNEMCSTPMGEREIQLEDYFCNDADNNSILQYFLNNLSSLEDDVSTDLFIADNGYGYIDNSCDRYSMIFNEDAFFDAVKRWGIL